MSVLSAIAPGPALLAAAVLAAWLVLLFGRGGFWRLGPWLPEAPTAGPWPEVAVIVPARDEAETIARTVRSILMQDYPGRVLVMVVDDGSADGTARYAREAARALGEDHRLAVIDGAPPPAGWTGKLWALEQGVRAYDAAGVDPAFLWLCDADVAHAPDLLSRLVSQAARGRYDLVSLMVLLDARGRWGRLLIPPFVFFFRKLYPFRWVADPGRRTAAAAGACVLLRTDALVAVGGFPSVADRIIDDCALARQVKHYGPSGRIWLGLTRQAWSLRPYRGLQEIWTMVARSAYAQLGFSPLLLAGTVAGMAALYLLAPLLVPVGLLAGWPLTVALALLAWAAMAVAAWPTYRLYLLSPAWGLLLPAAAALYTAMTVTSAWTTLAGRGGAWKGRYQASHPPRRRSG
jgi:hopene-associated glycosyltransferase HpnB